MRSLVFFALLFALACDPPASLDAGGDAPPAVCEAVPVLETGDAVGHPDPLGVGVGEARAGRIDPSELPQSDSELLRWGSGEILLANEHLAMAIEEPGPSDLYDPWGGRPTGIARIEDGALAAPGDFGEVLILVGRHTVMSESVTVMSDGSDGGTAVVRAEGPLRPLPFFQAIVDGLYREDLSDLRAAIDYELAPGSRHVEVYVSIASGRARPFNTGAQLHGFMFTPRMPAFTDGLGFAANDATSSTAFLAFGDERHTSFAYEPGEGIMLAMGVNVSGFVSRIGEARRILPCQTNRYLLARLYVGGPGVDGVLAARHLDRGEPITEVRGVVRTSLGEPAEGALVHVLDEAGYVTRSVPTGADGGYVVHVPQGRAVRLEPTRTGDGRSEPVPLGGASTLDLTLPPAGRVAVAVTDVAGEPLPARISVLPSGASRVPAPLPGSYGGPPNFGGRVRVEFAHTGAATLGLPVGTWEIVASRGYEYDLARQVVTITEGATETVSLVLDRVVDTTDVLCGDFHIHTRRSNDSPDDPVWKVESAVAEGLELPVRSDHEYVADFQPIIEELGLTAFAHGIGSIEMTSMELWGHMGVFPLVPDETAVNGGAPLWQEYPTPETPDVAVRSRSPVEVFDAARARPEAPVVIINHPRGSTNYFGYVGFDAASGTVERSEDWDEEFDLVEVFNDSGWRRNRGGTVSDWLGLLDHGRRVFAVGSSDTHELSGSPVGYPRTCIELGTDDPRAITPSAVRDALAAGHATVSGGIYVDASVEGLGPGRDASGLGTVATVQVRVQAAEWIDVDELILVVDGVDGTPIPILPGDADPTNPVIRWQGALEVPVDAMGSYVIVAAYGDAALEPVHPGRIPFGVTNPIFLRP
jgi:hypothetical protein